MSNQTIPIQLVAIPVPVGVEATDINGMLAIVAQYLGAQIAQNISFYAQGATVPGAFVTSLFYNTAQNVLYGWNIGSGAYLPITQFLPGEVKNTYSTGDNLQQGWVVLNGRLISAVTGLSLNQQAVSQQLFGVNGSFPNVTPIQNLSGVPTTGAFSGIANPAITPPSGQIGNLPFGANYDPSQPQALAANTETLLESTVALQAAVSAIQTVAETLLDSLQGGTITLISQVFVGYP